MRHVGEVAERLGGGDALRDRSAARSGWPRCISSSPSNWIAAAWNRRRLFVSAGSAASCDRNASNATSASSNRPSRISASTLLIGVKSASAWLVADASGHRVQAQLAAQQRGATRRRRLRAARLVAAAGAAIDVAEPELLPARRDATRFARQLSIGGLRLLVVGELGLRDRQGVQRLQADLAGRQRLRVTVGALRVLARPGRAGRARPGCGRCCFRCAVSTATLASARRAASSACRRSSSERRSSSSLLRRRASASSAR